MIRNFIKSALLLIGFILCFCFQGYAQEQNRNLQTVVHLLGYIARDYPNAVNKGNIINEGEYKEQKEFSHHVLQLVKSHPLFAKEGKEEIVKIHQLIIKIEQKEAAPLIAKLAQEIQGRIIQKAGIKTDPRVWPDIQKGEKIYRENCVQCHGETGNGKGELAASLDPPPANFLNPSFVTNVSPYQAFNSIKLGVTGTSMPAFTQLSLKEKWNLAFYVKSLSYKHEIKDTQKLQTIFATILKQINLKMVATSSEKELYDTLKKMGLSSKDRGKAILALRTLKPTISTRKSSLSIATKKLNLALQSYKNGDIKKARTLALNAYLEGIEPVEAQLRAHNSGFVAELESAMFKVRSIIEQKGTINQLQEAISLAQDKVVEAKNLLHHQKSSYWLTFLLAGSIFLREGLEAFLILAVILALIKKADVNRALPWLHGGWILALIMGIAGWFLSDYLLQFGGKNREIMEGLVSLLAVLILFFAGFWLHKNTSAKKWQFFVDKKIGGYLKKDRMVGLAAFSFMVVFREAFEVILFLQAVNLEAEAENKSAIGLGVVAAAVCILLLAIALLRYAKKLPIRQLFLYSSWFIVLLAIILLGKGIHALQESGWISIHEWGNVHFDWLGIYPTAETIIAQIILLLAIGFSFLRKRNSKG